MSPVSVKVPLRNPQKTHIKLPAPVLPKRNNLSKYQGGSQVSNSSKVVDTAASDKVLLQNKALNTFDPTLAAQSPSVQVAKAQPNPTQNTLTQNPNYNLVNNAGFDSNLINTNPNPTSQPAFSRRDIPIFSTQVSATSPTQTPVLKSPTVTNSAPDFPTYQNHWEKPHRFSDLRSPDMVIKDGFFSKLKKLFKKNSKPILIIIAFLVVCLCVGGILAYRISNSPQKQANAGAFVGSNDGVEVFYQSNFSSENWPSMEVICSNPNSVCTQIGTKTPSSIYFGNLNTQNFDYKKQVIGVIQSPEIAIPSDGNIELEMDYKYQGQADFSLDKATLTVFSTDTYQIKSFDIKSLSGAQNVEGIMEIDFGKILAIALDEFKGQKVKLQFGFDSVNEQKNDYYGFEVKNVKISKRHSSKLQESPVWVASSNTWLSLPFATDKQNLWQTDFVSDKTTSQNKILYYGNTYKMNYDTGRDANGGRLISSIITLPATMDKLFFKFDSLLSVENNIDKDRASININFTPELVCQNNTSEICTSTNNQTQAWAECEGNECLDGEEKTIPEPCLNITEPKCSSVNNRSQIWFKSSQANLDFETAQVDISKFNGRKIQVELVFDTVDSTQNSSMGWQLKNLGIWQQHSTSMPAQATKKEVVRSLLQDPANFYTQDSQDRTLKSLWSINSQNNINVLEYSNFRNNYENGKRNAGSVFTNSIQLPAVSTEKITLDMIHRLDVENTLQNDQAKVIAYIVEPCKEEGAQENCKTKANPTTVWSKVWASRDFEKTEIDLTPLAGKEIVLEFNFDTIDSTNNMNTGWKITQLNILKAE